MKHLESVHIRGPSVESPVIAKRISELTSSNDYVYVAGEEPQILYYAHRRSPTRFVNSYQLLRNTPMTLSYQQEVVNDLRRNPPKVIVFERRSILWGIWKGNWEDNKYLRPTLLITYLHTLWREISTN